MRVHAAWAALGTVTANKLKRDIVLNVARIMLARAEDVAKIEKMPSQNGKGCEESKLSRSCELWALV